MARTSPLYVRDHQYIERTTEWLTLKISAENYREYITYMLMKEVMIGEGKTGFNASREYLLTTYAECLQTVNGIIPKRFGAAA